MCGGIVGGGRTVSEPVGTVDAGRRELRGGPGDRGPGEEGGGIFPGTYDVYFWKIFGRGYSGD